jgi:hypothetical protein
MNTDVNVNFEKYKSSLKKEDVVEVFIERKKIKNQKYYRWVNVKRCLLGKNIFIVGGGPSLK